MTSPTTASIPAVDARRSFSRRRLGALLVLAVTVAGGLFVHAALPDTAATDIAGDALYAVAVYLGVVVLAPRLEPLIVGAVAAGWCIGIELFQLTEVPLALAGMYPPAMLVLGTVFDARDLIVYPVAVAAACAADAMVRRWRLRR